MQKPAWTQNPADTQGLQVILWISFTPHFTSIKRAAKMWRKVLRFDGAFFAPFGRGGALQGGRGAKLADTACVGWGRAPDSCAFYLVGRE